MSGTLGWAFSTWLSLIALQAVGSRGGAGRISQAFADVDRLLERALDPTVPAIPDLRAGAAATGGPPRSVGPLHGAGTTTTTTPRLPVPGQMRPV